MLAVVFARDGAVPAGGDEVVAECGGRVLVCGTGAREAAAALQVHGARAVETGHFEPGALAQQIAALVDDDIVVLPGSPDGRDLAPRLAHVLRRRLLAGAIRVTEHEVFLARGGGREIHEVTVDGPFVATMVPGVRGTVPSAEWDPTVPSAAETVVAGTATGTDCAVLEVLGPDVATMDLAEAPRILSGGAGLDSSERFDQLTRVATALGASVGATRVVTDRGWLPHARQIGTTGCVIDPELYLAFGISGAVQHTAGLGQPQHILSVNTDPHCPMMQLADLAIVCDANAALDALEARMAERMAGQRG
ncbi:MAG: electron transfer flavoprotein subunit alpha/FixB family protein [Actinobacteria bacterium]|uniref:Unannotated protein n=1 Tax=freshwater metagenome TaxID=449393 RepID=A0A6J7P4G0_9ZZZZ|nr:electron transfer flavoprotein subunit alpha/FixB family protein [Actinomycetota bacterium]MSX79688.1 electron transfer flavoprotein subunit alpha/FixB family protein [Actinomycetota bacterium]